MQDSFKSLIGPAKSILVILPTEATFDQVASGLGLYLALSQETGKEINIYAPSPMIVEFNRLVGVNKIKNELGNKNLAISFANYNPQGIEKVSWDIDNGQFKLTIVPKVNVTPPSADQLNLSYTGVAAEAVILIGGKDENSFPALKNEDLQSAKLVHIGISQVNLSGKSVSSLATTGSSISEVMANLLKAGGYKIEGDMATDLVMGIEETTNGFSTKETNAETFILVGELMKAGGKRLVDGKVEPRNFPMGAIPGLPTNPPSSWMEQPKIFKGTSTS